MRKGESVTLPELAMPFDAEEYKDGPGRDSRTHRLPVLARLPEDERQALSTAMFQIAQVTAIRQAELDAELGPLVGQARGILIRAERRIGLPTGTLSSDTAIYQYCVQTGLIQLGGVGRSLTGGGAV
jgi:hypothetical protein